VVACLVIGVFLSGCRSAQQGAAPHVRASGEAPTEPREPEPLKNYIYHDAHTLADKTLTTVQLVAVAVIVVAGVVFLIWLGAKEGFSSDSDSTATWDASLPTS
jgi:hypothetical protein